VGHAGREAQLYVPRLLSVIGSSEAASRCFGEVWHKVPLPLLLPWVAQMLSLLDAAQGGALLPPLKVSLHALSDRLSKPLLCLTVVLDANSALFSETGIRCYAARVLGASCLTPRYRLYHWSAACTPASSEKTRHIMMEY